MLRSSRLRVEHLLRHGLPALPALPEWLRLPERPRAHSELVQELNAQLKERIEQLSAPIARDEAQELLAHTLNLLTALGSAHGISPHKLELRRRHLSGEQAASTTRRKTRFSRHPRVHKPEPEPTRPTSGPAWQKLTAAVFARTQLDRVGHALRPLKRAARPTTRIERASHTLNALFANTHAQAAFAELRVRLRTRSSGDRLQPTTDFQLQLRVPSSAPFTAAPFFIRSRGSLIAVWVCATTSRVVFRYVIRPYLVRTFPAYQRFEKTPWLQAGLRFPMLLKA
jgi:hypothetical protein